MATDMAVSNSMKFPKQTIRDISLNGKTVLVRVDYNVPLNEKGEISDDLRVRASLPTLRYLLERGCKLVLMSHLGRPKGRDTAYSLAPVAERLQQLLQKDVIFIDQTVGEKVYEGVRRSPKNSVILLENLRFEEGEKADSPEFAKELATCSHADYFVQDAFGNIHRSDASMHAITLCLPSVAGLLVEREYTTIKTAMEQPKRPLVAVLGGAKVSDKIEVVEKFVAIADTILIGGAMANTFLAYKGVSVGKSRVETDQKETLDSIYAAAREKVGENVDDFIILPRDVAVAPEVNDQQKRTIRQIDAIQADDMALDIGDESIEEFTTIAAGAGTVVWNGPLGVGELPEFSHGSARLCLALATHPDIESIIGGGDTADFALKWDSRDGGSFTHVSTGGGASLDLMAGKRLPGIDSLLDARR